MSIYDIVSNLFYQHRLKNEWSMEQMAGCCEISERQYGDLERGKRLPTLKTIIRIAKKLDLDLNDLKEASDDSLSARERPN